MLQYLGEGTEQSDIKTIVVSPGKEPIKTYVEIITSREKSTFSTADDEQQRAEKQQSKRA